MGFDGIVSDAAEADQHTKDSSYHQPFAQSSLPNFLTTKNKVSAATYRV